MNRLEADLLATWAITMPLHSTLLQVCYALFLPGEFAGPGALPAQSAASPRTPLLLLLLAGPRLAGTSATSQRDVG